MSADDARARYFAWRRQHPHEAEDPSAVWAAAWHAGAWDAIRKNATLGINLTQIVERLEELAALYREADIDQELERASAYWRSDA